MFVEYGLPARFAGRWFFGSATQPVNSFLLSMYVHKVGEYLGLGRGGKKCTSFWRTCDRAY